MSNKPLTYAVIVIFIILSIIALILMNLMHGPKDMFYTLAIITFVIVATLALVQTVHGDQLFKACMGIALILQIIFMLIYISITNFNNDGLHISAYIFTALSLLFGLGLFAVL